MNIVEEIGFPAVLEQLAEECCELGQAALKLARCLREENPTPASIEECSANLGEETLDVVTVFGVLGLFETQGLKDLPKYQRWEQRIEEAKKGRC